MGDARLRITGLMTEYAHEPVRIDEPRPRFSWQIVSDRRCETQSAYQVLVADDESDIALDRGTAWDSGKVDSEQSIHVEYSGKDLEATRRYFWKVRVWDSKGQPSEYSGVASFEMGLWTSRSSLLRGSAPTRCGLTSLMKAPCSGLHRSFEGNAHLPNL